ncbi:hypothetical protein ACFWUW_23995 [Streptomyces sp. NPDC058655]|uniref:effector-associated constant component EACC1 n=1 Tax=Streptomyces sp. NPDC058655 TaxID=3346577 RepID=UPI00364CD6BA
MTGHIEISHPDGTDSLEDLKTFLVRHPETRRMGRIRWENAAPKRGELGDGLDILTLAITGVLALPGFVHAVSSWIKSRGSEGDSVQIRLGAIEIIVSGTEDPAQIKRLADVLKAAYPEEGPQGRSQ